MGLFDGTALERPVLCDRCEQDLKVCVCPPEQAVEPEVEPSRQRLKVRVDKRKRGKLMTVASGFTGSLRQRQTVLSALKNHCGAGGTIVDDSVEIQGDHVVRVREKLEQLKFRIAK